MSNGGPGSIFGDEIPQEGFLGRSLLEEASLGGELPGLGDIINGMGSSQSPSGTSMPAPDLGGLGGNQSPSSFPNMGLGGSGGSPSSPSNSNASQSNSFTGNEQGPIVGGVSDDDLVMHLRLDETSGRRATDSSPFGGNNRGILRKGATFREEGGPLGGVVDFDGVNDYIQVRDSPALNRRNHHERTLSIWFQVNDLNVRDRKQVIYEEGGTVRGLNIYIDEGQLYVGGWNRRESRWQGTYLSTDQLEANTWHNVSVVLDAQRGRRSVQSDVFSAYLDGDKFGEGEGSQLWRHANNIGLGGVNQKTRFHDGIGRGNGSHSLGGSIGDAQVYNRALSEDEISILAGLVSPPPTLNARLANDTAVGGTTNTDGITSDPSITGVLTGINQIASFQAGFETTPTTAYVDITSSLQSDGSFSLTPTQLDTIFGSALPAGEHTLQLQALDATGAILTNFDVVFTLDQTAPDAPQTLALATGSDSGPSDSDQVTNINQPTITGVSEPGSLIQLWNQGQLVGATTTTDATWQITTDQLADGVQTLQATATDLAGNLSAEAAINLTIDTSLPQVSLSTPLDNTQISSESLLRGQVDGTGSEIAALSYRFNNRPDITVGVNATGQFEQGFDFTGLTDGVAVLTLTATDTAGNQFTDTFEVDIITDATAPVISVVLANDTAAGGTTNTDGITADATIQGTVSDLNGIVSLRAGLDNTMPIDYEDITSLLQADGSFTLDEAQLSTILGTALTDGDHILYLQAVDSVGNSTDIIELAFTLDRTKPTVDLLTPLVGGEHSPTARLLGEAQDQGAGVDNIRYALDGQNFVDLNADGTGAFDAVLAGAGLAAGAHQLMVEVTDIAGNVTQTQLDFQVSMDLLVGPTASQGWVARSNDAVVLGEQNSFVSEASLPVALGQDTGSRTLTFDLNAVFDGADADSLPDQVLVYLVDANDPSQTLLDQGVAGTPVFALGEQGAEFQAGLVRFNGSTVEIDVTSVTATQGLLVFQLINGDADTGSVIQVSNLTNEVDETGVASPVFPMRRDLAQPGAALDLSGLTATSNLDVVLSKVNLETETGRYVADLQIENMGAAIGRQVAVVFDSLPDGVTLLNASGTDSNGNPYINLNLAIRPGGLLEGGISDAVQVVFDNPNLVNLALQPQVLVGGVNQAPVLEPITVPQLMPGEVLKLPLQATDPDGDPVTYTLRSDGELPTGILRGDGTLEFRPTPDQIGTYTFTIVASDGALETTQEVTLEVVADPITTTRISGVIANVDQQPLAGVRVEVAGVEGITADDGSFTLEFVGDLPGDTLKIYPDDINTATEVYPFIAEKLPLVLGHDPYGGVNNVIDRPIYLPVLDIANGQVVDPTQDTTVTTATIPGAAVTVTAGSLLDQQGNPFSGVLSITEVPAEFTPAALPPNLNPDLVVTIQPGEMVFDTPAALELPNLAGFEPGELMDLWSINPVTGDFDKVGVGQVSADGTVVETIEGGILNSSWHFFARRNGNPQDPDGNARNRDFGCNSCADSKGLTSVVETHTGALVETHNLVSYQSLGANRGVTLTYDSLRADARPIVNFSYSNVRGSATQHLIAKLSVRNGDFTYEVPGYEGNEFGLTGGEHIWSVPDRGDIDAALQVDLRSFDSGIYTYDLLSGIRNFNGSSFSGGSSTSQGQLYHINSIDSVFGSGWGIAGLQEIVESSTGSLLLIDGDGSELFFTAPNIAGEAYQSPGGDFSTLVRLADGTFQRTTKDQSVYRFNDQNQLVSMTDRNGNVMAYEYDANAQISKIIDPVGLETTFSYTDNRVTQITDPAGKVTQLDYDTEGNLLRVTDPDGESRTWSYDVDRHMTGEVDKRGNQESSYYDFAGRVTKGIRKDGSVVQVAPVSVQGLYRPELTTNPLAAPEVFTLGAVESAYADGNGNITLSILDQAGQVVSQTDGVGTLPAVDRNGSNLVTQSTDGKGHVVNYTYDAQGNVISREERLPIEVDTPYLFSNPFYEVQRRPYDVDLQDLNGDGQLDLIVANREGRSISTQLGNGDGTFQSRQDTRLGDYLPGSMQMVDLNNDGNLDIVTRNSLSRNTAEDYLSILIGKGDGTFNPRVDLAVSSDPESLVIGDLNGDGNLDIYTFHSLTDTTNLLLGDGNGGFSSPTQSTLRRGLFDPTLVDINADGRLDLVASDRINGNIALFLGNGDGTFTLEAEYNPPGAPFDLEIVDVDNNGTLDIVTEANTTIYTLFGNGDGTFDSTFVTTPFTARMRSMQAADLNDDGFVDLVGVDSSARRLTILEGDGTGQFSTKRSYASANGPFSSSLSNGPTSLSIGDLNGDSFLDVVTVNPANETRDFDAGAALIYLGNGDGTLSVTSPQTFSVDNRPKAISSGDFNLDGSVDVVTANSASDNVTIQFGQAGGGFSSRIDLEVGDNPNFVVAQDLNKDGFLDILTTNESSDTVSILLGTGDGNFAAKTDYAVGRIPRALTIADLNGDTELDLFVTGDNSFGTVLIGQGDGTFTSQTRRYDVGDQPEDISHGDLNGDNLSDLVTVNRNSNSLSVLLAQSQGGYAEAIDIAVGNSPQEVVLEDVDGDGQLDALVANNNNQVSVGLGQGDGTFNFETDYTVGRGVQALVTADLNGDSFTDFATANSEDGTVTTYFGQGDGSFTNSQNYYVSRNPDLISLADLNGDGTLDITTVDSSTTATTLWGNGDGSFTSNQPHYLVERGGVSELGDLNGDGFQDLVTANPFGDDQVSILLGNNAGTFNPQLTEYVLGEKAVDLALVDVNGDNHLDIVSLHAPSDPNGGGGGIVAAAALAFNTPTANSASPNEVSVSVLLGNGDGSFGTANAFGTGVIPTNGDNPHLLQLTFGDVNGDGNVDLLTTDAQSSSIAMFLGNGDGSFGSRLSTPTSTAPTALVAGDINGDGQLDFVSINGPSSDGGGPITSFSARLTSASGAGYGDDGSSDTTSLSILIGNGDGSFTTASELQTNRTPETIHLADLNGDGQLDILTGNDRDGTLSAWLGNGNGSFQDSTSYEVQRTAEKLTLADVNQDGSLDVLINSGFYDRFSSRPAYRPDSNITLVLGNGDGSFAATIASDNPDPPDEPEDLAELTAFAPAPGTTPITISGIDAESLHLVDMNQDGILDLVNTNSIRNIASIYRGNGDGSFVIDGFSVGNNPQSFVLADVNGDGIADSVSGNDIGSEAQVTVQFGNGDGSFAVAANYAVGRLPGDIQLADVNGDGVVDILTANTNSNSVSVLLGNGDGTFADQLVFSASSRPTALTLTDTNGDGFLDIIATGANEDSVSVLVGNGDGTFIDRPNASGSKNVLSGDLNNDGVIDIVSLGSSVLLGAGNGTFPTATQLRLKVSGGSDAALVDINKDDVLDLVISRQFSNQVGLLLGNGDGTFGTEQRYDVGDNPQALAVGDINIDGFLDILTANSDSDSVSLLLGNREGSFAPATHYFVGDNPSDLVLEDFDQDGDLDIVTSNFNNNTITLQRNRTSEGSLRRSVSVEQIYTYDSVFNQLTSSVDELGRQTLYEIDPNNGNLLTLTRVVGEVGGGDDQITRFTYTNQGLVDLVTDPLNRVTDYDYNNLGLLTQMTLAQGTVDEAVVQYEYDAAGNQTAVIDENGNRTQYAYDALNRLTQIIEADPDGAGPLTSPITTYTYDEYGNVVGITDARGNTTQSVYDERDRLVQVTDALNGQTSFEYDMAGNLAALTDELGHTTEFRYDTRNRQIGAIDPEGYLTQFQYDANNNLTKTIDPLANETSFTYDVRNRRIRQTDAFGRVTKYGYDAVDNLISQVDRNGNATTFAYDDLDRLISSTDALDGVSTTTYDVIGNVIAVTDELGRTTQFDYDNRDRLTQITDPLNGITTFAYDGVGNLLSVTDELSRTTTYQYDALNRQVRVSDPLNHTTAFGYDAVDNLVSVTDALGRITQYDYDALNRETTRINALGDTHSYTYDAADNVIAVTDELGRTTTFTYDDRDLRTSVTDALGHTTTTEYDGVGNVTAVIDALGHTSRYGYDALYRLTSETDAIGQTTTYAYDPVGNLLRITDPENNSTTYTYDALYRRITDTNELGDSRSYSYDAVDNQIGMTDRNGRQIEYTYDELDRQTQEIWVDAAGNPIRTFDYTYDAADQLLSVNDPDSAYTYTYDLAGRLTSVDNAGTPVVPNVLLTYTYDAVNNMLTVTDSIDGQVSGLEAYTYDALDRVTRLTQSGNGIAEKRVDFAYDVASQMTGSTRYADLAGSQLVAQSDYTFDLAGRLTNLSHSRDSVVIADYRWDYDAANRIIRFTSPDGTSDYNYDDRNQIIGSDHSYQDNEGYSYDNNGNRTNPGYETGDNNRLLSDGTYTYTYDAEGNRITRTEVATGEVTEYVWDYRNRLTGVVTKDDAGNVIQDVEYGYDVYDRRIEKTVDPDGGDGPESEQTERFVYDGDHIALVFDENGEQTHRYLHGPQIDQVLAEEVANGEVRWALADNQGTIRDVIDSDGNVIEHITYDSFGQITSETNPEIDFRFGYTGREFDEETGQYYYRARYYDAGVGRFISEDSIGFSAGDTNLYRYVFNNSTNYIDPSGNIGFLALVGLGILGGAAFNIVRQNIAILQGSQEGLDVNQLLQSAALGGLLGPLVGTLPYLAVPLSAFGVHNGLKEISCGNYGTGIFDIATSLAPFASKKARSNISSSARRDFGKASSALKNAYLKQAALPKSHSEAGHINLGPGQDGGSAQNSQLIPLEGDVGTYKSLKDAGHKGDNVTPHHIPSNKNMAQNGVKKNDGVSINMEQPQSGGRHRETFTYGSQADSKMSSRDALAAGIKDAKAIYKQHGLYNSKIKSALRQVIQMNKDKYPHLFNKK